MGKCPQCGSFNSMVEEIVTDAPSGGKTAPRGLSGRSTPHRLADVSGETEDRIPIPMGEFARVLGGGLVPGSIVLVGGDPGIGKSTLMLQVALEMAHRLRVLYVSGEESERQIKMRAGRICLPSQNSRQTFSWSPRPTWRQSSNMSASSSLTC